MSIEESIPDLDHPKEEGEPIFNAPWEARAFALVVHLHQQSRYEWSEWVDCLAQEIKDAHLAGDLGQSYYEQWIAACEKLFMAKGLVTAEMMEQKISEILAEADDHDHSTHPG